MRNAFADEITNLGISDPRVVLLSGDIGNKLFDKFKAHQPERFFNCGVAEANMMSVAAGMAMNGLRPVTYTITPFITYRCFEQIRVDVCYHNVPVIIVGVGSGLGYASLGATHHSCEDIACLRALPNMQVVSPGDPYEVRGALRDALKGTKPTYIRIGKKGEPKIHENNPPFEIGKSIVVRTGSDVALLCHGSFLEEGLNVADHFEKIGTKVEVVSFHTAKPLDEEYLTKAFSKFRLVVTLEEHGLIGGFGSAVSEWYVDGGSPKKGKLLRLGLPDEFFHEAGEQEYAREKFGLSAGSICEKISHVLKSI